MSTEENKKLPVGRPKNSGTYGEETRPMRVPLSLWDKTKAFILGELKKR